MGYDQVLNGRSLQPKSLEAEEQRRKGGIRWYTMWIVIIFPAHAPSSVNVQPESACRPRCRRHVVITAESFIRFWNMEVEDWIGSESGREVVEEVCVGWNAANTRHEPT